MKFEAITQETPFS